MNILLLYPPREYYIFGSDHYIGDLEATSGTYPPIGLLYIAGALEKHTDHTISVCDSHASKMSHNDLKEYIKNSNPDIIGIYISTYHLHDAILSTECIKEVLPNTTIIAGGPHATLYPHETIAIDSIDYAISGEAEEILPKLIKLLETRETQNIHKLPNVLTKELTKNTQNLKDIKKERIEDLDSIPFPARHLTDHRAYSCIMAKRNPMTIIITSRGCPYNCYFCSNLESGQKVRFRSPKNVVDELQELVEKFDIHDFLFFDELFTLDKKRVFEICDEIIKRKLKIRWHCRSRIDVLDKEIVKKMKKAGLRLIQFGIETGNSRLQKVTNKNLDLNKIRETVKMVYKQGVYTYGDFILGLPTETDEETEETIRFAQSLKLDYAIFGIFHPIPKSVFYNKGLEEGLFHDYWQDFINNPKEPIKDFTWQRKDKQKYQKMLAKAYNSFYLRPSYMISHLFRLDSWSQCIWHIKSAFQYFMRGPC